MGLSLSNYVVTEAGFGADLGAEKFLNIKCVASGLSPKAVVLVATIRALRHHGGAKKDEINDPNPDRVAKGLPNLEKHIENIRKFDIQPVVAINAFTNDSAEEVDLVIKVCSDLGVDAVVSNGWAQGGEGTQDLARVVKKVVESDRSHFNALIRLGRHL